MIGICKLCGKEKKLVESHIIPKRFFMQFREIDDRGIHIASVEENEPLIRSQNGIYEKIVCERCESIFSPWDDYAIGLLLNDVSEKENVFINSKCVGYIIKDVNYHKLKLFFLSVLWRMSVSTHVFFNKIDLGHIEHDIKVMIKERDAGEPLLFPVFLVSFTDPLRTFLVNPSCFNIGGMVFFVMYFGGYKIFVGKGSIEVPMYIDDVLLKNDKSLFVKYQNLFTSREYKIFDEVSKRHYSD